MPTAPTVIYLSIYSQDQPYFLYLVCLKTWHFSTYADNVHNTWYAPHYRLQMLITS